MSEPCPLQWLESLRSEGASRLDPARFHYLEALSRRLPGQTEPVRRLLQDKLQVALADYARRFAQLAVMPDSRSLPRTPIRGHPSPPWIAGQARNDKCAVLSQPAEKGASPLAQLNQSIRGALQTGRAAAEPDETHEVDELASVRRFKRAWSSYHIHDKVEQAASRKPANAGPLNSHLLVLQSLAMMGELSDDYLRRFLVQVESLQWLDQASEKYSPRQAKPTRRSRQKK
jgi:Protein of unknown function (DUF2894)